MLRTLTAAAALALLVCLFGVSHADVALDDCLCFNKNNTRMQLTPGNDEDATKALLYQCVTATGRSKKVDGVTYYQYKDLDKNRRWSDADTLDKQTGLDEDKCKRQLCYRLTKGNTKLIDHDQTEYRPEVYDKLDYFFGTGRVQKFFNGVVYVQVINYDGDGNAVRSWVEQDRTFIDEIAKCTGRPNKRILFSSCFCITKVGNFRNEPVLHHTTKVGTTEIGKCYRTPNVYSARVGPEGEKDPNLIALQVPGLGVVWTPAFNGIPASAENCESDVPATKPCLKWRGNDDQVYKSLKGEKLVEGLTINKEETYFFTGGVRNYNGETYYQFFYGQPGDDAETVPLYWSRAQKVITPPGTECEGKPRTIFTRRYCVCLNSDEVPIKSSPQDGKIKDLTKGVVGTCYKATGNQYYVNNNINYLEFYISPNRLALARENFFDFAPLVNCQ